MISYRAIRAGEAERVAELVARVFDELVAPDYTEEGVQTFLGYAGAEGIASRGVEDHFVLVAEEDEQLLGMIEIRGLQHISLFFVEPGGRGIGRELLDRGLAICREGNPDLGRVTVNSSPYAVPIYERLGFRVLEAEQIARGMRYVPMSLDL